MDYELKDLNKELIKLQKIYTNYIYQKLTVDKKEENVIYVSPKTKALHSFQLLFDEDFYKNDVIGFGVLSKDVNVTNIENDSKETIYEVLYSEIEIYYEIYDLPNFEITSEELSDFYNFYYDVIVKKYNHFKLYETFSKLTRFVFADALLHARNITIYDYYDKLDMLEDLKKEDILEIRKNRKCKIIQFKKES